MKKTLIALSIIACTANSAHAEWRHQHRQYQQQHHQPYRGGYQGGWVAPLIGGAIVGGIIANQYYARPRYQPQVVCYDVDMTDPYGHPYVAQQCWRE